MDIKSIIVFGASGLQGQPQVIEGLRRGYQVKAACRNPAMFDSERFRGAIPVKADFDDIASLDAALEGVDAVLMQVPAMGDLESLLSQMGNFVQAMKRSGARQLIFNSSMWAPDKPGCGNPVSDGVLATEEALRGHGFPVAIFRPTVFMENLITGFMKPMLVKDHVYRYSHSPDLESDWIAHADVAAFMLNALHRPDLHEQKILIGGPERHTPVQLCELLSEFIGHEIDYQPITPRQMGEKFYELTIAGMGTGGNVEGIDKEAFIGNFDSFYTFINESPEKPFQTDMDAQRKVMDFPLTDIRSWAKTKDWSTAQ